MRLFEFDNTDPLYSPEMTVLAGELKQELERAEKYDMDLEMTAQSLLDRIQDQFDLVVDINDLYDIVKDKNHPLSSVIDNIQGDDIVFKGQGPEAKPEDAVVDNEKQEKIVADMANRAMK
jgi:hypothetical protein